MKLWYFDFTLAVYGGVGAVANAVNHEWFWCTLCAAIACFAWRLGWTGYAHDHERKKV